MDIRLTFDRVPDVYTRARPSYPALVFDELFRLLPAQPDVVEVGPGTGQATVDLVARGALVTALELGPNLASALRDRFRNDPALTVINSSFEDAPLAHHSFDCVTVATAYHWIGALAQVHRPLELLRPGGLLGVIDLIQVDSDVDRGYFERVRPIYERFGQHKWDPPKTYETVVPTIADTLRQSGEFTSVEIVRVPWDQTYTAAQYRDLLWTYSGTQMMGEPQRSQMVDELVAVIDDEFDGRLTRPLVAALTLASAP